jgi:hypothetical protein
MTPNLFVSPPVLEDRLVELDGLTVPAEAVVAHGEVECPLGSRDQGLRRFELHDSTFVVPLLEKLHGTTIVCLHESEGASSLGESRGFREPEDDDHEDRRTSAGHLVTSLSSQI